ncbi:hypothetical protein P7F88_01755 [Vibrio hannami]|uniref:LON peptidase substrate-binding domain-containing protein n=1 Tax=Vibrio hannami TaxID=2717094 RepID=UPI00240EF1D6|nr:LON peptidase substrate-binding domain-containing protein [Vibrio hannami]MDG3084880.1 hypothetical protein [Vibrio hannami]
MNQNIVDKVNLETDPRSPVFPLPIFLLSGGMQRLRIFEPKYVSMIANAHNTDGFVISLYQDKATFKASSWGTHVQLVDFDKGEDGILTVDVLADRLVSLTEFDYQKDGLLVASAKTLNHWSSGSSNFENSAYFEANEIIYQRLSNILRELFEAHPELRKLYQNNYFDYAEWVCARMLEIVPIPMTEKEKFVQRLDFTQLTTLLGTLCEIEAESR